MQELLRLDGQRVPVDPEPLASVLVIRDEGSNGVPEGIRVSLVDGVDEFVDHDVVLDPDGGEDESPVEPSDTILVFAPVSVQLADFDIDLVYPQLRLEPGVLLGSTSSARRTYQSITACRFLRTLTTSAGASSR